MNYSGGLYFGNFSNFLIYYSYQIISLLVCVAVLKLPSFTYAKTQADQIDQRIIDGILAENIREHVRDFSAKPHLAGTFGQRETANKIYDHWVKYKLDYVDIVTYDVLLTYPDVSKNNKISLVDENGSIVWESFGMDIPLLHEDEHSNIVQPFNAFSANGNITADLVYVNFGTYEDFSDLVNGYGMRLDGKIGIARYGKIFRGTKNLTMSPVNAILCVDIKVQNAQAFNLSGLIIYTDPDDYAKSGVEHENVFPYTWWMPRHGVQRGSVSVINGDLMTIDYPANAYMYRELPKKGLLPMIPVFPISYGDAAYLLCGLLKITISPTLKGHFNCSLFSLSHTTFTDINFKLKVRIEVNNMNERMPIHNVIGRINGSVEPDRYVILGNHRDSWGLGASDPISGTGCLLELTRVLGLLHQQGWKPKRTLIFTSWDAEEYSLIGSAEYVEDNFNQLKARAIAYLNVDTAVAGNSTLNVKASPLLSKVAYDMAKLVPNPSPQEIVRGRKTIYDTWLHHLPSKYLDHRNGRKVPHIDQLGSGSDFVPFQYFAGISSLDTKYYFDKEKIQVSNYPLYHTRYDSFHDVSNFIDPGFIHHQAMARYWALMGRYLADSPVLPLRPTYYGESLKHQLNEILGKYNQFMHKYGICSDDLKDAVKYFVKRVNDFEIVNNLTLDDNSWENLSELRMRLLNDKLMHIERGFLDQNGLPTKPRYKHMILAPSSEDYYTGSSFPALNELLYALQEYVMAKPGAVTNPVIQSLIALTRCAQFSTLNSPVYSESAHYYQTFATADHHNHDYLIGYTSRDICTFNDTVSYILKPAVILNDEEINRLLPLSNTKMFNATIVKNDDNNNESRADHSHGFTNNSNTFDDRDKGKLKNFPNPSYHPSMVGVGQNPTTEHEYYNNGRNRNHTATLIIETIKKHIAVLSFTIRSAAAFMDD